MTVEDARAKYANLAEGLDTWPTCGRPRCGACRVFFGEIDAASIVLDLAIAEAAARRSVAY